MHLLWNSDQAKSNYDAVEKDIAHVNIFFEENHCMGELEIRAAEYEYKLTINQCAQSTNAI